MTCDNVTIGARQSRQRAQRVAVQLVSTDAGRNRRLIAVGGNVFLSRGVVLVVRVLATLVAARASAPAIVTKTRTPIVALLEPTATAILKATASVITTLEATITIAAIIARTEITAIIITTLETAITIAAIIAETTTTIIITTLVTTTTIIITTLVTAAAIITLLEPTATAILKATASVITTLVTAAIPTTIIARTEITAIIITTLVTAAAIIITTLEPTIAEVRPFTVAVTPLRLALLVSTTAKFAASSSLFCHGVYPLFLRRLALLSAVRDARSTTQY